jgi:hypothetical protein
MLEHVFGPVHNFSELVSLSTLYQTLYHCPEPNLFCFQKMESLSLFLLFTCSNFWWLSHFLMIFPVSYPLLRDVINNFLCVFYFQVSSRYNLSLWGIVNSLDVTEPCQLEDQELVHQCPDSDIFDG